MKFLFINQSSEQPFQAIDNFITSAIILESADIESDKTLVCYRAILTLLPKIRISQLFDLRVDKPLPILTTCSNRTEIQINDHQPGYKAHMTLLVKVLFNVIMQILESGLGG